MAAHKLCMLAQHYLSLIFSSVPLALVCFFFLIFTELLDLYFARAVSFASIDKVKRQMHFDIFLITAAASTIAVAGYAVPLRGLRDPADHFNANDIFALQLIIRGQ